MAASQLPSGTVTFLFTDIEGSTRLIEELGEERYVEALAEHRRLLREAFSARGGVEVDTQGDAFLYAFAEAGEALVAAAEGQQALAPGPVRVRMGVHTGDARLTGEGYAGHELHRAARIAASGHGGQVLVSAATAALVQDERLRDLGEHRLKDLSAPERIYQLGEDEFPRLKTLYQTNLPVPATPLVGRERELEEIAGLLRGEDLRLLTLSGPGGTGKTRLALQAAAEASAWCEDGVFWVPLAPLRDPALVVQQAAQAVESRNGLAEHLADKRLMLLLDNFEQVVEAAPELAGLLQSCPRLKLLVTSRELLRISAEVEYPVPPLAEPEAVELFCARSRLEPDETIAELCRRLDNLPLALELAAARTRVLSSTQLLERLSNRLDLLKGGRDAEARQQTLRATIEWSHDLLSPDEQGLFRRLAVFRRGCSLEAAEEVAGADLDVLHSLVDKSLVRHTEERFWMLETIRAYARERLAESADEAELRRRHGLFFLEFAEERVKEADEGGDQAVVYARMDAEQDNLRATLEWARDSRADEVLLRLVAAIVFYWRSRGFHQDLDTWLALALERGSSPARARMRVLRAANIRASSKREWARSETLIAEWRRIAEQEGDERQVLMTLNAEALNAMDQGDLDDARAQLVAIGKRAAEIGDGMMAAFAAINVGDVASLSGDFRAGLDYSGKAAELFRELGMDEGFATALGNSGWNSLWLLDPARAAEYFREALAVFGRLGETRTGRACDAVFGLAAALVATHEEEHGTELLGAASRLREELGIGFEYEQQEQTCERAVVQAKAALGEEAFAAAWARGEPMTPEEIVAFALAE
jgi:predicted ATPase/class 3 adenylate cyclase